MSAISRSNYRDFLWPGIKTTFGTSYKGYENGAEYKQIFEIRNSVQAYEKLVALSGLGLVPQKTEGDAVVYDTMKQGYDTKVNHYTYASGFIITMEELQDNLYPQIAAERPQNLAFVFKQTKEIIGANVLNRAFSGTYPGGDAVSLCNNSHPIQGGVVSNNLNPAADLSEAALEQAIINISDFVDNRGNKIAIIPQKLIVAPGNMFEAKRILGNPDRPDTAERDINAMYHMNSLPKGYIVNHYLEDPDAWFIQTDAQNGLLYFQRTAMDFTADNDYDTRNAKYSGIERFSFAWGDYRGIYGSQGV